MQRYNVWHRNKTDTASLHNFHTIVNEFERLTDPCEYVKHKDRRALEHKVHLKIIRLRKQMMASRQLRVVQGQYRLAAQDHSSRVDEPEIPATPEKEVTPAQADQGHVHNSDLEVIDNKETEPLLPSRVSDSQRLQIQHSVQLELRVLMKHLGPMVVAQEYANYLRQL